MKTKVMVFGNDIKSEFYFNCTQVERVDKYKYLGVIINSTKDSKMDIFAFNADYLCHQARRAIISIHRKTKYISPLPLNIACHLYRSLVQPIMLYGSDVWGKSTSANASNDKLFNWFLRCTLGVKLSTSNLVTVGECGQIPPSVIAHMNILCYDARLKGLPESCIAKQVYNELCRMNCCGFINWVTHVQELARTYDLHNYIGEATEFKAICKSQLKGSSQNNWLAEINYHNRNPKLRTYSLFKMTFGLEPYLTIMKDPRYRNAITRLRSSSHNLEIEKGRHCRPKVPPQERFCHVCRTLEDEKHFLITCELYNRERTKFFDKLRNIHPEFDQLTEQDKFLFLMTTVDQQTLAWLGQFVYTAFKIRNK